MGRNLEQMSGDLSRWMGASSDIDQAENKQKSRNNITNKGLVMTEEETFITIDDKPYKKNELDDNQLGLVNKLTKIQQNKNNVLKSKLMI